jgi:hypothetical protein
MGQDITTFNIDELITSYIDNQITDPDLKRQIEETLKNNENLNKRYQAELLTKKMLSSRLPQASLPQATYSKVMSSIDGLIAGASQKPSIKQAEIPAYPTFWESLKQSLKPKFLGVPRYGYAVILMFIIFTAVLMFNDNSPRNPHIIAGTEKSIMVQAVNVFHKVLAGDMKCQFKSGNAAEVEKYVNENANFKAYIPTIENYELQGCMCNEYNGQKLAHLIYMNGEEVIYIYQTPVTAVQKNNLELPDSVHDEIVKAKYFMWDEIDENNCTLTLWYKDNVVCASVTTLPKQKMHSTFISFNK